jgi:uncharacterized glyoxalase superfamily protein PhnB
MEAGRRLDNRAAVEVETSGAKIGAVLRRRDEHLVDWGGEELVLAGISKGNCRMFLANSDYRKECGNVGPVLIWLNLESKDEVNDLYRLWSSSKAKLISEPESKPWGLHEFMAKDLDGNLFRVFYDFGNS